MARQIDALLRELHLLPPDHRADQMTETLAAAIEQFKVEAQLPDDLALDTLTAALRIASRTASRKARTSADIATAWQDTWRDDRALPEGLKPQPQDIADVVNEGPLAPLKIKRFQQALSYADLYDGEITTTLSPTFLATVAAFNIHKSLAPETSPAQAYAVFMQSGMTPVLPASETVTPSAENTPEIDIALQTSVRVKSGLTIDDVPEPYFAKPRIFPTLVGVDPGSASDKNGFVVGDRIARIGGRAVASTSQALAMLDRAAPGQPLEIAISSFCKRGLRILTVTDAALPAVDNPFADLSHLTALQAFHLGQIQGIDPDILDSNLFSFIDALGKTTAQRCIRNPRGIEKTLTLIKDGEVRDPEIKTFAVPRAFYDFYLGSFDRLKESRISGYKQAVYELVDQYGCDSSEFRRLSRNIAALGGPAMSEQWERQEARP